MPSSNCPVCFEIYTEGNRCPKLLPCTHTVCVLCLRQLVRDSRVQCPECRLHHSVSSGSVHAFPTNRYVLEIIELAQRNATLERREFDSKNIEPTRGLSPSAPQVDTANEPFIQPGTCELHNKPFSMFCFEEQCNKMLCHTCFIALGHQNHGVMYLYQQEASNNSIGHENNPQTWASAMNDRRRQHPDSRAPQEITLSPTALNDRRGQYPSNHTRQETTLSPTVLEISQDNFHWPRRNNRNKSHGSTMQSQYSQYCKCIVIYLICLIVVIMTGSLYYIIAFKHIWIVLTLWHTLADPRFHRRRKVSTPKVEVPTFDLAKMHENEINFIEETSGNQPWQSKYTGWLVSV